MLKNLKPFMTKNSKQYEISNMFSQIANHYDLLNHILSFNIDKYWRKKTAEELSFSGKILLDVCGGTGDMAFAFKDNSLKIICDFCHPLLLIAKKKSKQNKNVILLEANALCLPLKNDSVDAITIAFGLRNIPDINAALNEFYRVLKKNGKLAILEFSIPKNKFFCFFYSLYLKYLIPIIGKLISDNYSAYSYLFKSIQSFPQYDQLLLYLQKTKFRNIYYRPLTLGISTIYIGIK